MTRLKYERRSRGLTQTELAAQVKLHQGHLSEIECGRRIPTPDQLAQLGAVLGVPPEDLLKDVVIIAEQPHA